MWTAVFCGAGPAVAEGGGAAEAAGPERGGCADEGHQEHQERAEEAEATEQRRGHGRCRGVIDFIPVFCTIPLPCVLVMRMPGMLVAEEP
jgi:hypothetical protein